MGILGDIGKSILGSVGGLAGSLLGGLFGKSNADSNIAHQREFAQKGIQWKVADAKAAGIHPLYALGAQTHSFTPVHAGDVAGALSDAGQHLGRAVDAGLTHHQRKQQELQLLEDRNRQRRMDELRIQEQEIRNMLLTTELMGMERRQFNQPAVPSVDNQGAGVFTLIPGQHSPYLKPDQVKLKPAEIVSHQSTNPHVEAGTHPALSEYRLSDGRTIMLPSEKAAEAMESMPLAGWMLMGDHYWHEGKKKPFPKFNWTEFGNSIRRRIPRSWYRADNPPR